MELIKKKDIRWDIVKETGSARLGWPVTMLRSNIGMNNGWFRTGNYWHMLDDDLNFFYQRIKWNRSFVYKAFRFNWNGFLWFWRAE